MDTGMCTGASSRIGVWKRALGGRRGEAPSRGRRGAGPRTLFERIMSHAPVAAYLYILMKNETNCISWV